MSIKDRKQELSRGGMSQRLEKANPPLKEGSIKSPIKDFSMSKIKQYLSKSNLELLQKTGLPSEKRGNLGEKWLKSGPSQFGSLIQPEEIDRRISQLRNEKSFNERQGKWETAKQIKKDIEGLETMKKDLFKK
jgi:hypothetical protein